MTLMKLIARWVKVWGVGFESDLPPEFVVSLHAEQRLIERMGCSRRKIPKVVMKAYYGRSVPLPKLNTKRYYSAHHHPGKNRVAREMMGYVFIFAYTQPRGAFPAQKVLVTVV